MYKICHKLTVPGLREKGRPRKHGLNVSEYLYGVADIDPNTPEIMTLNRQNSRALSFTDYAWAFSMFGNVTTC